jgi:hypothetical protein
VSESDSFINEVTEEVRREKLSGYLRRYGWIGVVLVAAVVGGAAWNEYTKAQEAATAQALGDNILTALEITDGQARAAAMAAIPATGPGVALVGLLTAGEQFDAGDTAGAMATLETLAANPDVGTLYRDLAAIKLLVLGADTMDPATRRTSLEVLAAPGAPFRLLALEQMALADLAAGETDAAIAMLRMVIEDAEVTAGLRDRASGLIVALGGTIGAAPVQQ